MTSYVVLYLQYINVNKLGNDDLKLLNHAVHLFVAECLKPFQLFMKQAVPQCLSG